jgi:hypothetical protein
MSVALRGNLEDFGLSDVFQLIGQQRKTGVLEISNDSARVQLRFDSGRVVSAAPVGEQPDAAVGEMLVRRGVLAPSALQSVLAECASTLERVGASLVERGLVSRDELDATEGFLTSETIFELLRQNEGSFHFSAQPVAHERDPADLLGAEEILMEGLRMVDEWRTLSRVLPPEDAVLKRKRSFDAYLSSGTGEARKRSVTAERVYLLIDGRLTFRRVIDLSQLGTFEASRIVADLLGAGVVEAMAPKEPRARAVRADEVRPRGAVLASALVLGMLAALALLLHLQVPATAPGGAAMVAAPALDSARAAFEMRRLRNALDAWRVARGDWPDRLEELPEAGWLGRDALTSETGAPYYYARSDDGFVLLSPER